MTIDRNDPRLTAYVLGEVSASEKKEVEAAVQESEELRREVEAIRKACGVLGEALQQEPVVGLRPDQIEQIRKSSRGPTRTRPWWWRPGLPVAASVVLAAILFGPGWVEQIRSPNKGALLTARQAPAAQEPAAELEKKAQSEDDLVGGALARSKADQRPADKSETFRDNEASPDTDTAQLEGRLLDTSAARQVGQVPDAPARAAQAGAAGKGADLKQRAADELEGQEKFASGPGPAQPSLETPGVAFSARSGKPEKEVAEIRREEVREGAAEASGRIESVSSVVTGEEEAEGLRGLSARSTSLPSRVPGATDQRAEPGRLAGVVFDRSPGALPGARVSLTSLSTFVTVVVQSDQQGGFRFPDLAPGRYQLKIELPGFLTYERDLVIEPGREVSQVVVLRVGAPTTAAEVYADAIRPEINAYEMPVSEDGNRTATGKAGDDERDRLAGPAAQSPPTVSAPAAGGKGREDLDQAHARSRETLPAEKTIGNLPLNGRPEMPQATLQAGTYASEPRAEAARRDVDPDETRPRYPHPHPPRRWHRPPPPASTESYDRIEEHPFVRVEDDPRSTFSIDVDTASFSNVRRFLEQGTRPPRDAVRIEELINYFPYDYPQPRGDQPFSISLEVAEAPWRKANRLVRIGLKGREIPEARRPSSNLVFLIDVSGSMRPENKLPLLKKSMRLLVERLTENDTVALVVYAGASGLVLPPTTGDQKGVILRALENLHAGGSTNGGAGIELAYRCAREGFIQGGVNRVILATDGDFNVGITNQGDLVRLIEERRRSGVFLSVLGFGMGNLKDASLEKLADRGNGNYSYIDSEREARKVLVEQMNSTLVTIAQDVKIQIEFNPARVQAYRLIGYENRVLAHQDFNDDGKDAGEIGSGHTVTALYEVVPAGVDLNVPGVDPLRYQPSSQAEHAALDRLDESPHPEELLFVRLRYKQPEGTSSRLMERALVDGSVRFEDASRDFRFAAAVASFGMLLRDSVHRGDASFDQVLNWALAGRGEDSGGYRQEFLQLVIRAQSLELPYLRQGVREP